MKKLFSILVLGLFLLSSFSVAFAEEGRSKDDTKKRMDETVKERQEKIQDKALQRDIKLEDKQLKMDKREEMRKTIKDRVDAAKLRKDGITDAAKILREQCKAKDTTEGNCGEAFTKIKEHLTTVVDRMIEAFTALKQRMETSDTANKSPPLEKIDKALTELQALKTKIAEAKTRDELKAVMREVREKWVNFKQLLHEQQDDTYQHRARSLLEKATKVQDKLKQALERLKSSGTETERLAAIETALQAVDAQVLAVKQAISQNDKTLVKSSLQKLQDLLKEVAQQFFKAGKRDAIASLVQVKTAPVTVDEMEA